MKIAVCVKHAGRLGDEIELVDGDTAVDPDFLERELDEWDTHAAEAALRLREQHGGEVVAVTFGDEESEPALRHCLAMGADRAVRLDAGATAGADALEVGRALAAVLEREAPDLILCGVQSSDLAQGATGGAIAGTLGLPVVTVVSTVEPADGRAVVRRELEGGHVEVAEVDLPAVLTMQSGDEPRTVTLQAVHAAAAQTIEVVPAGDHAAGARARVLTEPERRPAELIPGPADAVAQRLRELIRDAVGG